MGNTPASPFLRCALTRLQELALLPYGWSPDRHAPEPIQALAMHRMLGVVLALDAAGLEHGYISPISGGALQIEWSGTGEWAHREIEIACRSGQGPEMILMLVSEGAEQINDYDYTDVDGTAWTWPVQWVRGQR